MENEVQGDSVTIREAIAKFGFRVPTNRDLAILYIARCILKYYLGEEWFSRHFATNGKSQSPFLMPLEHPRNRPGGAELDGYRHQTRVVRIAECLLNFASVEGFGGRIKKLQTDDVESVAAEMESAALLFTRCIPFRFVDESCQTGTDFDLEARFGESVVACEAKCKIEGTELNENTIRSTLNKARSQLPTDKPCLVFLQVPESWGSNPTESLHLNKAISKLFRNSARISAVMFTWDMTWRLRKGSYSERLFRVAHNRKARFPLPQLNEYMRPNPTHWRRIADCLFPEEQGRCSIVPSVVFKSGSSITLTSHPV